MQPGFINDTLTLLFIASALFPRRNVNPGAEYLPQRVRLGTAQHAPKLLSLPTFSTPPARHTHIETTQWAIIGQKNSPGSDNSRPAGSSFSNKEG